MISIIIILLVILKNIVLNILYIDPGTGSLILQVILGGVITFMMFFKTTWRKITSLFKNKDKE